MEVLYMFYWCKVFQTFEGNYSGLYFSNHRCALNDGSLTSFCYGQFCLPNLVYIQHNIYKCIFTVTSFCAVLSLVETSGDPPLKATDSSATATQEGSDKQYKKVLLWNLLTFLNFVPCSAIARSLNQNLLKETNFVNVCSVLSKYLWPLMAYIS